MGKLPNLPYCKKCVVLYLFLILLELLDTYPCHKILMSENSPEWSSPNWLESEKREALVNWAKSR